MATDLAERRKVSLSGKVYTGKRVGNDLPVALFPLGLLDEGTLTISETLVELPDMESPAGGTAASMRRIEKVEFSGKFRDFNKLNLARAQYSSEAMESAAGDVTDEKIVVPSSTEGIYLPLMNLKPSVVVVSNVPTATVGSPTGSGTLDNASISVSNNRGVVAQTVTLTFSSATEFTATSSVNGVTLTAGNTTAVYAPQDANGHPYFTIPVAAWSGTWAGTDTVEIVIAVTRHTENTDYEVQDNGLVIPAASPILNSTILVSYAKPATFKINGAQETPDPVYLVVESVNKADGGKRVRTALWKVQFGPAESVGLFQSEFAELSQKATVEKDSVAKQRNVDGVDVNLAESDYYYQDYEE